MSSLAASYLCPSMGPVVHHPGPLLFTSLILYLLSKGSSQLGTPLSDQLLLIFPKEHWWGKLQEGSWKPRTGESPCSIPLSEELLSLTRASSTDGWVSLTFDSVLCGMNSKASFVVLSTPTELAAPGEDLYHHTGKGGPPFFYPPSLLHIPFLSCKYPCLFHLGGGVPRVSRHLCNSLDFLGYCPAHVGREGSPLLHSSFLASTLF